MRFQAKKGQPLTTALLASFVVPVLIIAWSYPDIIEMNFIGFLLFLPAGILLYLYFGTVYIITNKQLHYRSVLINGFIDIDTIEEVGKRKPARGDVNVATAPNGLVIRDKGGKRVYISPANNDLFIDAILKVNPHIKIII